MSGCSSESGDRGAGAGRIARCHRAQAGVRANANRKAHCVRTSSRTRLRRKFAKPGKLTALRLEEEKLRAHLPHRDGDGGESESAKRRTCWSAARTTSPAKVWSPAFPQSCRRCPPARRTIAWASRSGWSIPANPLPARVTVNRFWQMYFGTGLVKTVEDFGIAGRMAVASGTARLARHRVRPHRLGREGACRS